MEVSERRKRGGLGEREAQRVMHGCWSLGGLLVILKNAEVLVMGICIFVIGFSECCPYSNTFSGASESHASVVT